MLAGERPSVLLREVIAEQPTVSSLDLDGIFEEEFPDLPQEVTVISFLWEWNKSGLPENNGINDEELDRLVCERLLGR